jgi:phage tail-like protein
MTQGPSTPPVTNSLSTLVTDPVRNFKFLVKFTPTESGTDQSTWGAKFGTMGFVSVSGLSVATEAIAYREGGYNTNVHQMPGQSAFTPITLSKGVMLGQGDNALWMKRMFSVLSTGSPTQTGASAAVGGGFRCNIDIQVLSHPNPQATTGATINLGTAATAGTVAPTPYEQHTSLRFRVYRAWITSLAYSGVDAGSNSIMVEEMSIVHEGWDVTYASDYTATGSAPAITNG